MSQNVFLATGITSAAVAAGYLLWRNGCKKRASKGELVDTNFFPNTSILTQHADATRCDPKNDAELASLLEQLLRKMKFNKAALSDISLSNAKNTEKEFQFKLECGDFITVLSGISTDDDKVFSRRTV